MSKDILHNPNRVAEELAASNPDEFPTESFENSLSLHVLRDFLYRMPPVTVTFKRDAPASAADHHVDAVSAYLPLRGDLIACRDQPPHYLALKFRLGPAQLPIYCLYLSLWVLRILNQ